MTAPESDNPSKPPQESSAAAPTGKRPLSVVTLAHHVVADVGRGFVLVTHHGMAVVGVVVAVTLAMLLAKPEWRSTVEQQMLGWLMQRQGPDMEVADLLVADPTAVERVTATDPEALPVEQARVAQWLSRKYRVAPEPLSALVAEAYKLGEVARIDPTLILSVMAVESRFNPFAASPVGAQGLMQVMTRVHTDKYDDYGGTMAAFDPVTNLRVGVKVLQETIRRAGSVEGGLRLYVGAVTTDGSDYIAKVMSEHERLNRVAQGQRVAFNAYQRRPVPLETLLLPEQNTGAQPAPAAADLEAEAAPAQTGSQEHAS
jgi:hypothetical protein